MKDELFLNKGGYITFKTLFWLILFAFAVYAGYKFVPPEFSYYMMKTDVETEAKNAHMYTDAALVKRILEKAETWSVPIDEDSIEIRREDSNITISVHYTKTLVFFNRYTRELKYNINVVMPLKASDRILQ